MDIPSSKTTYSANSNSANFCGPKINTKIKNTSTYSSNESLYNDPNNPYNKIDEYRKNHATDEQIKKDIEKYNSTVTDPFLKLDENDALSNIKKEMSNEKSESPSKDKEYWDIINGKVSRDDIRNKKGDFWDKFYNWCKSKNITSYGPEDMFIKVLIEKDTYIDYKNAGYTDEDISNIKPYPIYKDEKLKEIDEYDNEDSFSDELKIKNINCDTETKNELESMRQEINKLRQRLHALRLTRTHFEMSRPSDEHTTLYKPKGSDKYYYLPPKDGNNNLVIRENIDIAIPELEAELSEKEQNLLNLKKSLVIDDYEKVTNTQAYKDALKNLDADKILGYEKNSRGEIVPVKGLTGFIPIEQFRYLSKEEKSILAYYYKSGDYTKAKGYYDSILETLNYRIASTWLNSVKDKLHKDNEEKIITDLENMHLVGSEGFQNGFAGYVESIVSIFESNKSKTVTDYKNLLILQYLAEENETLNTTYKISHKIGELMIPATASFLTAIGGVSSAVEVMNVLMGAGTMGKVIKENSQKGYSGLAVYLDGFSEGLSEVAARRLLILALKKVLPLDISVLEEITNILATTATKVGSDWLTALSKEILEGRPIVVNERIKEDIVTFINVCALEVISKSKDMFIKNGRKIISIKVSDLSKDVSSNFLNKVSKVIKGSNHNELKNTAKIIKKMLEEIEGDAFDEDDVTEEMIEDCYDSMDEVSFGD